MTRGEQRIYLILSHLEVSLLTGNPTSKIVNCELFNERVCTCNTNIDTFYNMYQEGMKKYIKSQPIIKPYNFTMNLTEAHKVTNIRKKKLIYYITQEYIKPTENKDSSNNMYMFNYTDIHLLKHKEAFKNKYIKRYNKSRHFIGIEYQ